MACQGSKNLDRRPVASQLIWEKEEESQGTEELATAGPSWEKGEQGPGLGQGVGVGGPGSRRTWKLPQHHLSLLRLGVGE